MGIFEKALNLRDQNSQFDAYCPCCGLLIEWNMALSIGEKDDPIRGPMKGDVAVCHKCLNWLMYDTNNELSEMSEEQILGLDQDAFAAITNLSKEIAEQREKLFEQFWDGIRGAKIGARVIAIWKVVGDTLNIFGHGKFLGGEVPPPEIYPEVNFGRKVPKIELDSGEIVWGIECCLIMENNYKGPTPGHPVAIVSIEELRRTYGSQIKNTIQ